MGLEALLSYELTDSDYIPTTNYIISSVDGNGIPEDVNTKKNCSKKFTENIGLDLSSRSAPLKKNSASV